MTTAQFSLMWDAHNKTISNGLSSLQQNGEFVDMTLAADGHHVKVHQMIMALASPYIKELIASAQCPHPVIFLNKISYATLCSLLEYIYTGQVLVTTNYLPDLVEAGKQLHIQGLKDMNLGIIDEGVPQATLTKKKRSDTAQSDGRGTTPTDDSLDCSKTGDAKSEANTPQLRAKVKIQLKHNMQQDDLNNDTFDDGMDMDQETEGTAVSDSKPDTNKDRTQVPPTTKIQYTVSAQGAIQMVLNRYIYYLRYSGKRAARDSGQRRRRWRCSSYDRLRCPAAVFTEGDVVVKRIAAHTHTFHDKQILRRVQQHAVYSAISEAEVIRQNLKLDQSTPVRSKMLAQKTDTDTE